jgi:hypothetical protein
MIIFMNPRGVQRWIRAVAHDDELDLRSYLMDVLIHWERFTYAQARVHAGLVHALAHSGLINRVTRIEAQFVNGILTEFGY